jgi:hypothetical protein
MRQYTVCNSFIPEFYLDLFNFCQAILNNKEASFNKKWLESGPCSRLHLTLKNYKISKGLSAKIHAQKVNEGKNLHMIQHCEDSEVENNALAMYRTHTPHLEKA